MFGIEIIISGVVYVVTNGALAGVILMLKKVSKKKYAKLEDALSDLMRRNTAIYEMLSEPQHSQQTGRTENLDEFVNEPYVGTPSEQSKEDTHRDIELSNGNVVRIRGLRKK